jgi:hypothetical protein
MRRPDPAHTFANETLACSETFTGENPLATLIAFLICIQFILRNCVQTTLSSNGQL